MEINFPSSVASFGYCAFASCHSLVEANLSTTRITNISPQAFFKCSALQTVSLPNTLEEIYNDAFGWCSELVTVVLPRDSKPIRIGRRRIGRRSFHGCEHFANLVLPKGSAAEEDSFIGCNLLHKRYGEDSSGIVAGLVGRFDEFPFHKMCYHHHCSITTVRELLKFSADQQAGYSLVDDFGMTPFHVLFSTADPCMEILDVLLLDSLPSETLLKLKDANGRQPLDYLLNSWTDGAISLLDKVLQKWMIDRLAHWGVPSWMEAMQSKVQEIIAEDDKNRRALLLNEAYSAFKHYENVQATSILEMALWKWKLNSGWSNDDSKRQVRDRGECRCLSGSDVVIQNATPFLFT